MGLGLPLRVGHHQVQGDSTGRVPAGMGHVCHPFILPQPMRRGNVLRKTLRRPIRQRTPAPIPAAATSDPEEEPPDIDKPFEELKSSMDKKGAGSTFISPAWLVQLGQLWGGKSTAPVVNARPEDVKELLGGALFRALYKWMLESGPVYLLPTGPVSSFLVISDPKAAKHVLQTTDNQNKNIYEKGLVREVSEFLFGTGFAISGGEEWRVRRKAVAPSLHRPYLGIMIQRVFAPSAYHLNAKLERVAASGTSIDMEACFSQLTLDVIGKAVFNYDFDALTANSPIIQAVYTALKETETRATDLLPLWKLPFLQYFVPRFQKASAAVDLIRETTEQLIAKCKQMVDEEEQAAFAASKKDGGETLYINESDPSVLRFLIASREVVEARQLRDDLLSMLVAGHETTGSVLTWTLYLLVQNPVQMTKVQEEIERVLGDREIPTLDDYTNLKYVLRCVNESMRLYPHPPVLLRRALKDDTLPGGVTVPQKQDVMISVYNIHHSPDVWEHPEAFMPERFPIDRPAPTEVNTGFRYIPFSGGARKCVGDQFALMEAVIALAVVLRRFEFALTPNQDIGMTTGATIHTTNGLFMTVKERARKPKPALVAVTA